MKYLAVLLLFIAAGCSDPPGSRPLPKEPGVYYPFAPRKEVDFQKGNKERSLQVLRFWKHFESGTISKASALFADTITLSLPDVQWKGERTALLKRWEEKRSRLSTAQVHIDFWQPVTLVREARDAVLLWAQVEGTLSNGKRESHALHQLWIFDGRGKISSVQEYQSGFHW